MILEILSILLAVIILAIIINDIEDYYKQKKRVNMSFKEAMDLTELPIITFINGNKKLNFLLDTGSNICQINSSLMPELEYKMIEGKTLDIIGIEGNKITSGFCEMTVKYKNQEFVGEFFIHDLSQAFDTIKAENGVQIHGIIGSLFLQKYKYILDFVQLIAYSKK